MITSILRKAIMKTAEKIVKSNPSDVMTQMNLDDVITIFKSLL